MSSPEGMVEKVTGLSSAGEGTAETGGGVMPRRQRSSKYWRGV
ncbi:hypothetical protein [Gabonibacter chumensis]|nr:hypothetical protein [Gabonibacter chumensis]MCR9011044.1 hypothetical protein [Gabonibacter chumensis]